MADYITSANFKTRHGITVSTNDARIALHITAASREIDAHCGRQFGQHVGEDTVRYFHPYSCEAVRIADCYSITTVHVDLDDSGDYATEIVSGNRLSLPVDGVGINQQTGWPVEEIRLLTLGITLPRLRRPSIKVTGKWGWATTPTDISEACYLIAHRLYYEVAVPSGVTAPNVEFGLPGSPLQRPYTVERLLAPYRRAEVAAGVAG